MKHTIEKVHAELISRGYDADGETLSAFGDIVRGTEVLQEQVTLAEMKTAAYRSLFIELIGELSYKNTAIDISVYRKKFKALEAGE